MDTSFFLLIISLVCVFTFILFRYFSIPRNDPHRITPWKWYVVSLTYLGWASSFLVLVLLPFDIYYTRLGRAGNQQALTFVNNSLVPLWQAIYWISFLLTWFFVPLAQGYVVSGRLTFGSKLFDSLKINLKFYSIMSLIMILGLVWIIFAQNLNTQEKILSFCFAASNIWGFVILIALLSYGLAEFPKSILKRSNLNYLFARECYHVSQAKDKYKEKSLSFNEASFILKNYAGLIGDNDSEMTPPTRQVVDLFIPFQPSFVDISANTFSSIQSNPQVVDRTKYSLDHLGLANLNAKLLDLCWSMNQNLKLSEYHLKRGVHLFELVTHYGHPSQFPFGSNASVEKIDSHIEWKVARQPFFFVFLSKMLSPSQIVSIERVWYSTGRAITIAIFGTFCAILSLLLLFAEFVHPIANQINPFAVLVDINSSFSAIIFFVFIPLIYLGICSYWSLFSLRIFDYYLLLPHSSGDYSLLFSSAYLCRLCIPLCYNYLSLLNERFDQVAHPTAFAQVLGPMDHVPLTRAIFSFLPVALLFFAILISFNFVQKCASFLSLNHFLFEHDLEYSEIRPHLSIGEEAIQIGCKTVRTEFDKQVAQNSNNTPFNDAGQQISNGKNNNSSLREHSPILLDPIRFEASFP